MGFGAHGSHFARQGAERLGAKTPHRQVLGFSQSRGRETPGSSIRELRGGSCVTLTEAAPPWCLCAARLRSQQVLWRTKRSKSRTPRGWNDMLLYYNVRRRTDRDGAGLRVNEDVCFDKYSDGLNDGAVHKLSILYQWQRRNVPHVAWQQKVCLCCSRKNAHSLSSKLQRYSSDYSYIFRRSQTLLKL